jgi:hypothetical protein
MDPGYVSALAALCGSAIGAMASFATTWLTQHSQDRTQQRQREIGRREQLFGDFIDEASKLFAHSLTHALDDPSQLVVLYGIISKMRLFGSAETTRAADIVMDLILETYHTGTISDGELGRVAKERLTIVEAFTKAARKELT